MNFLLTAVLISIQVEFFTTLLGMFTKSCYDSRAPDDFATEPRSDRDDIPFLRPRIETSEDSRDLQSR